LLSKRNQLPVKRVRVPLVLGLRRNLERIDGTLGEARFPNFLKIDEIAQN
jgi:hypothetical protein